MKSVTAAGLLALAGICASPCAAQTPEQFYKGKQIELAIGYPPAGSNDIYARLLARHLPKHIPGNPTIVPQNRPGAGSFLTLAYVYNVAPKDGSVIGIGAPTAPLDEKLGTQAARIKRIERLAAEIAPLVGADVAKATRAAHLAKADLLTEVVGEFPEVQGLMGKYYALAQGEDASVAAACEEHYKPQGPADRVPTDPVSVAVALADPAATARLVAWLPLAAGLALADALDLDTDLTDAVVVVEWGEGVAERLADRHLLVRLRRDPDTDVRHAQWSWIDG